PSRPSTLSLHDALPISARDRQGAATGRGAGARPGGGRRERHAALRDGHRESQEQGAERQGGGEGYDRPERSGPSLVAPVPGPAADRKSTRLNSSHDQIS